MKITHINTNDIEGGAARAAYALHKGLRRLGYDSSMFAKKQSSIDDSVQKFRPPMVFSARLRRSFRRERIKNNIRRYKRSRPPGYEDFRGEKSEHSKDTLNQIPKCEVINLHWVADFIDYRILPDMASSAPIVWTLHDMNAFTGGCHYDHGCGKFVDNCGACPQLGSKNEKDLSYRIWRRKKKIFEKIPPGRLHIVTPSLWLAYEAKRSSLLGNRPVTVIPYGVDIDEFTPHDNICTRQILGISLETKIVLFVAHSTTNFRKGFHMLDQVFGQLNDFSNLLLISIGQKSPSKSSGKAYMSMGFIDNNRLLSVLYSAADIFVIPSLQDNLPNTVLESMACGTPVVGFNVGGIPDMVHPGVTGLLAPSGDVGALRDAIAELLENDEKREEMSKNCRRMAVEEYSAEIQAQRYLKLYQSIL